MRRLPAALLITALTLALAACSSAPPVAPPVEDEPDYLIEGAIANVADVPLPNVVSLVNVRSSAFIVTPATTTSPGFGPSASEYEGELLAIATSVIADDGSFSWDLGDGSEIPAAYMVPAAQAFAVPPYELDTTCSATTSGAGRVMRVWRLAGLALLPVGIAGPLADSLMTFDGLAVYTDVPTLSSPPVAPFNIRSWTFAEEDVSISGSCVRDNGIDPAKTIMTFDVDLVAGWNPLTANVDNDQELVAVSQSEFEGSWLFSGP